MSESNKNAENAPANEESLSAGLPTLYQHKKRADWGLGLVVQQADDRARIQFQDGRLRMLHMNYSHLLEPVDRSYDVARGLVEGLEAMAPEDLQPAVRRGPPPISLEQQMGYFKELFPAGFQDDVYCSEHRGDARKRPLKRHRDALIAEAKKHLTRAALTKHRKEGGSAAVFRAANSVLKITNVVPAKERTLFAEMGEHHYEQVDASLTELLHGKGSLAKRVDVWTRTLEVAMGETPTWPMSTVFLGALMPGKYAVVRPRAFERQAKFMAPGLRAGTRPMGLLYERLNDMVLATKTRLEGEGMKPQDLLDVRDFIWLTLKPAGRERIMERRLLVTQPMVTPEPALAA